MTWAVTDQASTSGFSGATLVLTVATSVTVGSLVVVGTCEASGASSGGTVTDSAGNSYTAVGATALNGNALNGHAQLFYSVITSGLTGASSTITYTRVNSGARTAMAALSATGNASSSVLDSAVTATTSGAGGASAALTSGTPTTAGELFVAWCGAAKAAPTADGTWTTPPLAAVASGGAASDRAGTGGYQINSGVGTLTHTPVSANNWANIIVGFIPPAVSFVSLVEDSRLLRVRRTKTMIGY